MIIYFYVKLDQNHLEFLLRPLDALVIKMLFNLKYTLPGANSFLAIFHYNLRIYAYDLYFIKLLGCPCGPKCGLCEYFMLA